MHSYMHYTICRYYVPYSYIVLSLASFMDFVFCNKPESRAWHVSENPGAENPVSKTLGPEPAGAGLKKRRAGAGAGPKTPGLGLQPAPQSPGAGARAVACST
jgi:hypothetical protein